MLVAPNAASAASGDESARPARSSAVSEATLDDLATQVHNPVPEFWQLTLFQEVVGMARGGLDGNEPAFFGDFQPQGPVVSELPGSERFPWLADRGFFARLTLPLVASVPLPPGSGGGDRSTGFGDIQLGGVIALKRRTGFVWGVGPTFIFPTASDDALGQGKWQAGPAAVAGYLGKDWVVSATAQQWWSFAGDDDRPETSQLCLNYVIVRNLPKRWQVGMQPTVFVDWKAASNDKLSLPVGLGMGRTVRLGPLPIQLWAEVDYYAVRPRNVAGARWGFSLQITPLIESKR